MYFSNFPVTLYQLYPERNGKPAEYVAMTDITRNVRFKKEIIDNIVLYDYYYIGETDSIEIVSEKLYNSPYYHWVLMLLNDRYDYVNDLPRQGNAFEEYVNTEYNKTYLEDTYDLTPESLIIDIKNNKGISTDLDGTYQVVNRSNNSTQNISLISVTTYEQTINKHIKKFYNKTTGAEIDLLTQRVNFGTIPTLTPKYAYGVEFEKNEEKRKIKIISAELLQTVLTNFADLL